MVLLKDMQSVNWKSQVMQINNRVTLENFRATGNENGYTVTFNAYNESPMAFGVYAYDADGNIVDRQFIGGMWMDSSLVSAATDIYDSTIALITTGRNLLLTAGSEKSEIRLEVPAGGTLRFLTAAEDQYVSRYNAFLLGMGVLDYAANNLSFNSLLNGDDQETFLKELMKLELTDWQTLYSNTSRVSVEEVLSRLMSDDFVDCILDILAATAGKTFVSKAESTLLKIVTLGQSDKINFIANLIGGNLCFVLMHRDLEGAFSGVQIMWPKYILFPVQ